MRSESQFARGDASGEAARIISLELFREGRISLDRAAELTDTPLATFMKFAASHRVPHMNLSAEDIEQDVRMLESMNL